MDEKSVAIVLAAGSGSRMKSNLPKQYMELGGKPVIYYSLHSFEMSNVDEVILVVGKDEIDYCMEHIIKRYNFKKVTKIVAGGAERYLSVFNGLKAIDYADYVLIHDGARPFVSTEILKNVLLDVKKYKACVVGVPSKDTIKIANKDDVITSTLDRDFTWIIQTPQAFSYSLIMNAYKKIIDEIITNDKKSINITDDAMVVEHATNHPIKLVKGSYSNIKVTTPEDIKLGSVFLEN